MLSLSAIVPVALATRIEAASLAPDEWRPFRTAPRDGTRIQIKTKYGAEPGWSQWVKRGPAHNGYGLADVIINGRTDGHWLSYDENGMHCGIYCFNEAEAQWRPYTGDVEPFGRIRHISYVHGRRLTNDELRKLTA